MAFFEDADLPSGPVEDVVKRLILEMQAYRNKTAADLASGPGASFLGFLQGGVGAVARTVEAKLREADLSVPDFGAAGTGMVDDAPAIQRALDAAVSLSLATGRRVTLPHGNFLINSTLKITRGGAQLVGDGMTLIAGTAGMTMLQIGSNVAPLAFAQNVGIEGVWFDGKSLATSALRIENNYVSTYKNIYIQYCIGDGIAVHDELYSLLFQSCFVTNCGRAFHCSHTGSASPDKLHFLNCNFVSSTNENVLLERVTTAMFVGGSYEKGTVGIGLTLACLNVTILGGHFETNSTADIYAFKDAANSASPGVSGLTIDGGFFDGTTVAGTAILLKGAQYVSIINPRSQDHTSCGIDATDAGLSGALNSSISIMNPNGLQDATPILHVDGVVSEMTKLAIIRSITGAAQLELIAAGAGSDWIVGADAGLGAGAYSLYDVITAAYRFTIDGGGHANVGPGLASASVALQVTSTDGAFLPPRMTTTQKNALAPPDGSIVFDTTLGKLQGIQAGVWANLI